jgi:hypothetical protein
VYEWMHTTRVSRVSVVVRVKRGGESKGVQVLRNLIGTRSCMKFFS